MTNSVAPSGTAMRPGWWLGGGGLMAVFPLAYATVLPALLRADHPDAARADLRGVAFEFRFRHSAGGRFGTGFCARLDGRRLHAGHRAGRPGAGIKIADRQYAGGWWDWLTRFSVLCGVALVVGYAPARATWLNLKTTGPLANQGEALCRFCRCGTFRADRRRKHWTPFLESDLLHPLVPVATAISRPSCRSARRPAPSASGRA